MKAAFFVSCLCFTVLLISQFSSAETNRIRVVDATNSNGTETATHTEGVTTGSASSTTAPTPATTAAGTTGTPATTGDQPSQCAAHTDCESCSKSTSCVWCDTDKACASGNWWGPDNKGACGGWRWKQCNVAGQTALIVVAAGAGGVVLLFVLAIVCCCCCCGGKKKRSKKGRTSFYTEIGNDDREPLISKTPQTDNRRKELYKKYDHLLNRKKDNDDTNPPINV